MQRLGIALGNLQSDLGITLGNSIIYVVQEEIYSSRELVIQVSIRVGHAITRKCRKKYAIALHNFRAVAIKDFRGIQFARQADHWMLLFHNCWSRQFVRFGETERAF